MDSSPTVFFFFRNIKSMFAKVAELCRQNGARPLFVYLPYPAQKAPIPMQSLMEQAAAEQHVPVLDLMNTLASANALKPTTFPGDVHLNEYGHKVVADALYQYLAGNGFLESRLLKAGSNSLAGGSSQ